jgi:hypothetical protein
MEFVIIEISEGSSPPLVIFNSRLRSVTPRPVPPAEGTNRGSPSEMGIEDKTGTCASDRMIAAGKRVITIS